MGIVDGPSEGWYPDPDSPDQLRWWTGTEWTDDVHPIVPPEPTLSPPNEFERTDLLGSGYDSGYQSDANQYAPGPPPPHITQAQPQTKKRGNGLAVFVGVLAGFALIVGGCVALLAAGIASDADRGDGVSQEGLVAEPAQPEPAPESDKSSEPTESPDAPDEPEADVLGTRTDPLRMGELAAVKWDVLGDADDSIWNTKVGTISDITAAVLDSNQFNDPPAEGFLFAGYPIEMTLAQAKKVPLSTAFNLKFEVSGGETAGVYDESCGLLDGNFEQFAEVYTGGTLSGWVCVILPASDLDHPDTRAALNFRGDRVYFGPSGAIGLTANVVEVPQTDEDRSEGGIANPFATDVTVPLRWEVPGDADNSVWDITVGPPTDITAAVLTENQFNDAPEEGMTFVGFDVEFTLISADKEPLSTGFNLSFEIIGGSSRAVHKGPCGVVPNGFDQFAEVFVGGTLRGTVCVELPEADIDHEGTFTAINLASSRRAFFK